MRALCDVAYIAKTIHTQGSFIVQAAQGLPFLLEKGMHVALVPPVLEAKRFLVVRDVSNVRDTSAYVSFDGVDTLSAARAYVGCHVLLDKQLVASRLAAQASHPWIGWRLCSTDNRAAGTIVNYIDTPMNPLFEVEFDTLPVDVDDTCLLVPAHSDLIAHVDEHARCISVRIAQGFFTGE